jgi:hypothetical protein
MWVQRGVRSGAQVALLTLVATAPALAAELLIVQPSACANADALTLRTERALGKPLAAAAELRCTVHIVHDQGALAARLELDAQGQRSRVRSFRAPNCERLTETLALAIVLAIGGSSEPDEPEPQLLDVAPSDAGTGVPASVHTEAAAIEDTRARVAARAELVADSGTLPALGLGPALGVSLRGDRLELRALGTYLAAREASMAASGGGSVGAQIGLLAGALLGCAPRLVTPIPSPRIELGACVGGELGWLVGRGVGVNVPRQRGAAWSAGRLDLSGRWVLGSDGLGLDLLLSALVPTQRHEFQVSGGTVHRPAAAVGRASVGISLDLD